MEYDEAIRFLRSDPKHSQLLIYSYIDENPKTAAERFSKSEEFKEITKIIGRPLDGLKVLDLGAGNGIASYAFASLGAQVYSLDPNSSAEAGRGAIAAIKGELPIEIIDAFGESIPLSDSSIDLVFARQALHHTKDLKSCLLECARVLKSGGMFFSCRDHVVDNECQLKEFLDNHVMHLLVGGENAYRLSEYLSAISSAGLDIEITLGPWDSIINAFPIVRTNDELEKTPRILLERRFGKIGTAISIIPLLNSMIWKRLKRPVPGRLYSFFARKKPRSLSEK